VLTGAETGGKYARLSAADRRAILEIVRETKPGLPSYWNGELAKHESGWLATLRD